MAHITLSQLTTVLQRIVSWATGKFAAKNTYSGKIEYADMPVVVLASMGSELDGTSTQRPMSTGSTYYLPAGQGAGAQIMFVDSNGTAVKISNPESNVIYCNAYTGLLYRWDASESDMVPVGGDVDGLRKVYVDNMDFSSLDTLYSGVYQVIDQTTQRIIGVLVASSDNRFGENPYFVTQWLFSNLLLSDEYSGSFNGYYTIGRAHIIHRFYNASNTSSDIPLNTWSEWKVYGLTLDEMSEIFNSKVSTISVNGGPAQTPNNGNVNLVIEAGAQGQKGDKGDTVVLDPQGLPQFSIVNDLVSGGEADALSAEMGRRLAMMSGTFAQAWARSKAIPFPFCFLWVETVNGAAISKPIWHKGNSVFVDATGAIINVPAASVPGAPTITGATSGGTVPKNTQITITPASGSALYYSIDGGSTYHVSDNVVTLTLATAGSVSIVAYCANNAGNSSSATLQVTVAGTAVPTFSPNGGEVARGGSVTISVPAGGELHYKVNSGAWQTASGNSVSVPITGATTIQAYNVQDGDTSSTISKSFTMAALAAPSFSVASGTEFPATGGSVELTGPTGATIYYTTDGSTPTTSSTQYTGTAIAVTSAMTIKAIAHDNYGDSAVAEASYSVTVDHKFVFKIKLSGDNSTEYVPVSHQNIPGFSSNRYTMSVDWGDGTVDNFTDKMFSAKECSHAYTGAAGDEKTITLRGSAIPALYFAESATGQGSNFYGNVDALVAIIENTLTCDTYITINGGCSSLSTDALSNNVGTGHLHLAGLTSFPAGLLNHLSKTGIDDFSKMFEASEAIFSAENMQELRTSLASATNMNSMFYGFKGTCQLPNNLFDLIGSSVVTNVWALTHTAKSGLTGDAKALYDVLSTKVTSSANTAYCFSPASLTNRNQVPNAWGGTAG